MDKPVPMRFDAPEQRLDKLEAVLALLIDELGYNLSIGRDENWELVVTLEKR